MKHCSLILGKKQQKHNILTVTKTAQRAELRSFQVQFVPKLRILEFLWYLFGPSRIVILVNCIAPVRVNGQSKGLAWSKKIKNTSRIWLERPWDHQEPDVFGPIWTLIDCVLIHGQERFWISGMEILRASLECNLIFRFSFPRIQAGCLK